jgi:uncharacterized membrane protein
VRPCVVETVSLSVAPTRLSVASPALLPALVPLGLLTALSLGLLAARMVITGNHVSFAFLGWNLFLAALPLLFALLGRAALRSNAKSAAAALFALWLGFLPNAPYLVSDLVHLHKRSGAPFWLDLTMLASFAFTGLLFGGVALFVVDGVVRARFGARVAVGFDVVVAVAAGLGVHLGRFDRWNTWDLLTQPHLVVLDVLAKFGDVRALGFAGAFAVLLLAALAACAPSRQPA